jgi:AcrR family transcriptional regulator
MSQREIEEAVETAVVSADDSADVQQRLLDAAEGCFAQFGIRKTTMEDVARNAGLSRATVYRHFKNRDDLLMGVVEREARNTQLVIKERLSGIEHAGDYIIEGIVQALIEIPKRPTLAMIHSPEAYLVTSRLILSSERLANVALEIAMPVIEPAREKGLLRKDVDIGLMIEWIYRLIGSYLAVPSTTAQGEDEIREQLRSMLLPALLG